MANRFLSNIKVNDAYTLPTDDGSDGQAIITDGSGNLSFGSVAAASADNAEAIHLEVKNTSGATINKGTPVYITGNVGNSDKLEIAPADASDASKMPAVGLLETTLSNNSEGYVAQGGYLKGLATATIDGTSTSSNDTVYVKAGGGLTMTKPTGTNYIQNVAKVARVHSSNGSLIVSSILRTNDVPTPLHIDHTNQRLGIGTTSPAVSLDIGTTDAVAMPSGTTAERPSSPAAGMIRYNSTDGSFEGYTTEWGAIGGGGGTVNVERNAYTGDGSDLTFDTTSTIDNENNVQVYIDGVYQSKANYSTSGNTVTFGSGNAPPNGSAVELIHHKGDTGAVIAADAIDTDQIVDDAVTFDKIEDRYTAVGTITNTSGATTVDWSSAAVYKMNAALTAAIEFDFTNYKAGQVLTIYNLSGSYTVTLDSDAATSESFLKLAEQDYDGSATSMLQIECLADGDDAVFAYSVAQYASDTTI